MKGYKGFDKDLKCRDFQYEVGKDYTTEGKIEACKNGFHFCENPMDVLGYYPPSDSRYCIVESSGQEDRDGDDSKVATSKIHISAEIGLKGLIEAGVKFILDKVNWKDNKESNIGNQSAATNTGNWSAATNTGNRSAATNTGNWSAATNTGYRSAATNTGNRSAATNTGYRSAATNTGNRSAAIVSGKGSVAMAIGYKSKAKGSLGCWIVLAEQNDNYEIIDVQSVKVDGEKIKADTFYTLVNGEFIETE